MLRDDSMAGSPCSSSQDWQKEEAQHGMAESCWIPLLNWEILGIARLLVCVERAMYRIEVACKLSAGKVNYFVIC